MVVPPRHSLVWLHAQGWRAVLAQTPAHVRAQVIRWRDANWPLTVRRRDADSVDDELCVGIALPPQDGNKVRLPYRVEFSAVAKYQPTLSLSEIVSGLPLSWRDAALQLHGSAQHAGLSVQVYGSAALQSITGLQYLHDASDLDLLLQPTTLQQLDDCVRLFFQFDQQLPLDGEIVFGTSAAVAAREWRNAAQQDGGFRVLAKQAAGVALMRKDALISLLDRQPCLQT